MATFTLPLITIWKFSRLRDEPMAVLVAMLAASDFTFGIVLTSLGVLEITLGYVPFCTAFQYLVVASAGAVKIATLGLAVDQYTAVSNPLRYHCLMERRLPWLIAASCFQFVQLTVVGGLFHAAGAITWHEFSHPGQNGTALFAGCRWEPRLSSTHMFIFEGEVFLSSLLTSLLMLYTARVGIKRRRAFQRRRRRGAETGSEHDRFMENFRAFEKILKLISLSLLLDVTTPVFRLYQRWHAMPTIAGVLHVLRLGCTILEGSTYGLMNRSLRKAYKDLLGIKTREVRPAQVRTITVRTNTETIN
ncbi:adenosine receptor A1-like [Amphibalanus amphitrite]|uniref:adenosine receptor A1-like n=1 Tax=Amphibalanus amphitrite TaxID=1232801 RepID=UPI001C901052|nr:adenosine receptor A1-like [Amphibalanus amphitrite]